MLPWKLVIRPGGSKLAGSNQISAAFSEEQAHRLTGVTLGQLRYWDQTAFFRPSYAESAYRSSFGKVYSFRDIVALRVLSKLRNRHGVSVQHLRLVKERLQRASPDLWTGVRLYVFNKHVYWIEPDTQLPQELASGQYVIETIDLSAEVEAAASEVSTMNRRDPSGVGKVEKRKSVSQSSAVIAGTRVTVRALQRFARAGYSVEQILAEYPDLTTQDVEAALAYPQVA